MYEEPEKKSDNEALNEILDQLKSINKRVGLFYWLAIITIIISLVIAIIPYVSWA
jgi:hypothetical protein